jgi:hypothetical protein
MRIHSSFHVFKVEDKDKTRWIEAVSTFTEARKLVKELMAKQRCGYLIFHESTGEKITIMPEPDPPRDPNKVSRISPST